MNTSPKPYSLPAELHLALANECISVSPTGEPSGHGADFYAFVFNRSQEDAVNAFGGTPCEAVAYVLSRLDKPWRMVAVDESSPDAAVAAIQFTLKDEDGLQFLRLWNEADFDAIRREWPEAPEDVFIGADPLYKPA